MSCPPDVLQTVQISDDEDTENVNNQASKTVSVDMEDVIVIDDESVSLSQKPQIEKDNCIEITKVYYDKGCIESYDDIFNENCLFAEYLEKVLNLDNSEGMLRVVNRNLVQKFRAAKESFKKSEEFCMFLRKSITLLDLDSEHKYSNVKNVCDMLKSNDNKKRIATTLLDDKLKSFTHSTKKRTKRNKQPRDSNKRQKIDVIDLENYQPRVKLNDNPTEIIDLDDSPNVVDSDVMEVEEVEKENITENNNEVSEVIENNSSYLVPQKEVVWKGPVDKTRNNNNHVSKHESIHIEENNDVTVQNHKEKKIKKIEAQIATYNKIIEKLEQQEVSNYDSEESPYIQCDRYKAKVVKLYNELCKLTGSVSVKHHTVRLAVVEGHPTGPVKLLEAFINNNIGSNGLPLFPDINDVIKCVEQACKTDHLNWNRQQILKEASALFTQCGRALQKRRQRREFRDLMSRVKPEIDDFDPADVDAALHAKLEANRQIAIKKERDLLEQYTRMELQSVSGVNQNQLHITQDSDSESDNHCDEAELNINRNNADISKSLDEIVTHVNSNNDQSKGINNNEHNTNEQFQNITSQISENNDTGEHNNFENEQHKNIETSHAYINDENAPKINKNSSETENTAPNNVNGIRTAELITQPKQQDHKHFESNINTSNSFENNISENKLVNNSNTENTAQNNLNEFRTEPANINLESTKMQYSENELVNNSNTENTAQNNLNEFRTEPGNINLESTKMQDSENELVNNSNTENTTLNNLNEFRTGPGNINIECTKMQDPVGSSLIQEDFNAKKETNPPQKDCKNEQIIPKVEIKREPLESILLEFGDDYEVLVFDIEDPFLIIEISDSSDEE